jgi:aryl-alcohol dehydrogenase-like predicted oxidoreductase
MIEKKAFGKTGHMSTKVIFGGAALSSINQEQADKTLEVLQNYGVNHLDLAASYGKGEAERRAGPWMSQIRDRVFLATKTGMRTYQEAKDELHSSLERLRVDSVDHIQMHNLIDPEEWDTAMGPKGALEALIEAKEQGLTRFIGVTGHGMTAPSMHLKSIERYDFDSVLLPYNFVVYQDTEYAKNFDKLVQTCRQKNIAVQTIKSIARRPYGESEKTYNCWYEPLADQDTINRAVNWVLGNPDVFLISAADINVLPKVLKAASVLGSRPSYDDMKAMVDSQGMELIFDGTMLLSKKE